MPQTCGCGTLADTFFPVWQFPFWGSEWLGISTVRSAAGWVSRSLIASGLFMAMSGVFPGDFENRTSPTMLLHAFGAFGSFIAFLISGFSAPALLRRHSEWCAYVWPSTAIVILSIASGFLRSGNASRIRPADRVPVFLHVDFIGWLRTYPQFETCSSSRITTNKNLTSRNSRAFAGVG